MDRIEMSRRRAAVTGIFSLTLAAVALVMALRGLEWHTFLNQIHGLDWRWLAVGVTFDIVSYLVQGVRWRILLRQASLRQTTRAIYAGLFLNEIVPLRPGEAVRAWLAARDLGVGVLAVAPTMVTERLIDGVWLAGAMLAMLALVPLPAPIARVAWAVVAVICVALIAALFFGQRRFPMAAKVREGLSQRSAFLVSGAFLLAQGLAFWAVARASHLSLGVAAAFVVMLTVRVGTMIPGAPANLGTHQFSTVLGLSIYGVPHAVAASFSLIVFVVLTVPLLLIGFTACLDAGLTLRDLRAPANSAASRSFPHSAGPLRPEDSPLPGDRNIAQHAAC